MSDQLTTATAPAPQRTGWLPVLGQAAVIVVAFAVVGVLCGFLWEAAWNPAQGEVVKHVWYPFSWDRAQPAYFAGTGWYVVIGFLAGVVVGGLASWRLDRAELVTLAALVVGGLLAAYLIRVVGLHRGPGNPQHAARTEVDGTKLPSELKLSSWWLLSVVPGGALAALSVVYLTVPKRRPQALAHPATPVPAAE